MLPPNASPKHLIGTCFLFWVFGWHVWLSLSFCEPQVVNSGVVFEHERIVIKLLRVASGWIDVSASPEYFRCEMWLSPDRAAFMCLCCLGTVSFLFGTVEQRKKTTAPMVSCFKGNVSECVWERTDRRVSVATTSASSLFNSLPRAPKSFAASLHNGNRPFITAQLSSHGLLQWPVAKRSGVTVWGRLRSATPWGEGLEMCRHLSTGSCSRCCSLVTPNASSSSKATDGKEALWRRRDENKVSVLFSGLFSSLSCGGAWQEPDLLEYRVSRGKGNSSDCSEGGACGPAWTFEWFQSLLTWTRQIDQGGSQMDSSRVVGLCVQKPLDMWSSLWRFNLHTSAKQYCNCHAGIEDSGFGAVVGQWTLQINVTFVFS